MFQNLKINKSAINNFKFKKKNYKNVRNLKDVRQGDKILQRIIKMKQKFKAIFI